MSDLIQVYQPIYKETRLQEARAVVRIHKYCMNPDACEHKVVGMTRQEYRNRKSDWLVYQECTKKDLCVLAIPIRLQR